ncbi:MAG: membrane integrity-associated transporter subunit PqiC [Rhodoferax sp.]|jgi:cholesterol transport system auxiliary component|nr:membrane integrity-associated transporter subunit PqiC [Rhodoferax sp.]
MKIPDINSVARGAKGLAALLGAFSLCACSVLSKTASPPPAFYALENSPGLIAQQVSRAVNGPPLTLIISPPHAASGYDSQRIVYIRAAHQLEYFARSEWVDPPARMFGPLLVSAALQTGAFAAVVLASGTAAGDLRLNTDILKLQHNFQASPSRVQLTLRAYLTDEKTRRVLAWKEFSGEALATSDTPQGGVTAANQVVQQVLTELAQFLVDRAK